MTIRVKHEHVYNIHNTIVVILASFVIKQREVLFIFLLNGLQDTGGNKAVFELHEQLEKGLL